MFIYRALTDKYSMVSKEIDPTKKHKLFKKKHGSVTIVEKLGT